MRAAVYEGEGRLVVRDVPDPMPAPDEVLIEVEACGVCGSDVQIINVPPGHPSTPPVIIGHEFVGWVRAVGSAVARRGHRRRGSSSIPTRSAARATPAGPAVRRTARTSSPSGCTATGRWPATSPRRRTASTRSPRTSPPEMAALVEPLACVVNGTNRAAIRPGETGRRLRRRRHRLPVHRRVPRLGRGPDRRDRAERPARAGRAGRRGGRRPDAGRVGSPARPSSCPAARTSSSMPSAPSCPRRSRPPAMGARVVIFGMNGNARPPVHQVEIVEKGLSILGSYISNFTFPAAIRLVESGAAQSRPDDQRRRSRSRTRSRGSAGSARARP